MNNKKKDLVKINATEARQYFGKVIKRAYSGSEHLVVEKNGLPVVVILSVSDYEEMSQKAIDGAKQSSTTELSKTLSQDISLEEIHQLTSSSESNWAESVIAERQQRG